MRRPAQDEARKQIRLHLQSQSISQRQLAKRLGWKDHAALSRFLSGRKPLPLETVMRIIEELGMEGRTLERVVRSLLPKSFAPYVSSPGSKEIPRAETHPRLQMMRFFFDENTPLIYEALKILGSSDVATLRKSLNPRFTRSPQQIGACLEGLQRMGLVAREGEQWHVLDKSRDIVIPSRYSNEIGKRILRHALSAHSSFLGAGTDSRVMRSILASIGVAPGRGWVDVIKRRMLEFQDDVLALESSEENVAVQVVVSAVEVARARVKERLPGE